MREKARIVRIIELIGQLWDKFPDQRLGQLLSNFVFGLHMGLFFVEDNIIEARLIKVIKFYTKEEKKNAKRTICRKS